jgi:endonuclease YncB( thermonuclease family)
LAVACHSAFAYEFTGRVVGIADGDTITVLDAGKVQHKVRLAGIDAPEKKQPFGQRSKENLSALVFGRDVTLDCTKRDKYRREVCKVLVDGHDANLEQVKAGLAWWYRKYSSEQALQDRQNYEAAEAQAKQQRAGLWGFADPMPPWEWRHQAK